MGARLSKYTATRSNEAAKGQFARIEKREIRHRGRLGSFRENSAGRATGIMPKR